LAQASEVTGNNTEYFVVAACALQLENVLHKVVAERVLDEVLKVTDDSICKSKLLHLKAFFQTALHHTATMLVTPNFGTKFGARLKHEVGELRVLFGAGDVLVFRNLRCSEVYQKCLEHVVSM
jgi:hypothetical protein